MEVVAQQDTLMATEHGDVFKTNESAAKVKNEGRVMEDEINGTQASDLFDRRVESRCAMGKARTLHA